MHALKHKLRLYYFTAIFSMIFAVVGFSYNAWRMEVSEDNNNIRTASFEVLQSLAELEQNIYAAHYDQDIENGSPRIGWVKIGLVNDLSPLISGSAQLKAKQLKQYWAANWQDVNEQTATVEQLVKYIDEVRAAIQQQLTALE